MKDRVDTLVVGCGVVGGAVAYNLAKRGAEVQVIDRAFPAAETSGATGAYVWCHTKTPGYYGYLSFLSAELYADLHHVLGMDVEYRRTGGIAPVFGREALEQAKELLVEQRAAGLDVSLLTPSEALTLEPGLSPGISGATYSPHDGHVLPFRLCQAWVRAGRRLGAEYSFYNAVHGLIREGEGFRIFTAHGEIRAHRLVITAGAWTPELAAMVGVTVPVAPIRGVMLVTEPLEPVIRHTVSGLRQSVSGEVLIGASFEVDSGFERSIDPYILTQQVAALGVQLVPALAGATIVRSFAGIRPWPKDGLPILGEVPGQPGLYVAAMHSGVTLSPIVGLLMGEIITGAEPSVDIGPYRIDRFSH